MTGQSTIDEVSPVAARHAVAMSARRLRLPAWHAVVVQLSVGLMAGALIALQFAIMRVFAVGSWAHFGSLVICLAMLGFGLTSAVLCIGKAVFEAHARRITAMALVAFGPLVTGANFCAQQLPFNAVFLLADPQQKWRLAANFALYLLPLLAGAIFLGLVFIEHRRDFTRIYFADLTGAGLGGALFFLSMYVVPTENLMLVPLALGAAGGGLWIATHASRQTGVLLAAGVLLAMGIHYALPVALRLPVLAVSDYKGVAYARKFPDSRQVYRQVSPFGDLQIYASSYLHFAPGLSDNAAFNLPALPGNSFLGLYSDGDGPVGVMRDLPAAYADYFKYLPMYYPYLLKKGTRPETFVVQFGGGISTQLAFRNGSRAVTVAERDPEIIRAFVSNPYLKNFTGGILGDPQLNIVNQDGRLWLGSSARRYDIIDLSPTNSFGLTSPGGFTVTETFAYTREAMRHYIQALNPGGILSVTLWNKEEPPKSVLKLYATMADAARVAEGADPARSFFVFANYLSTATVLYKQGGFTDGEIAILRDHTAAMSFDEIYYPGEAFDLPDGSVLLNSYSDQIFGAAVRDTANPAASPAGPASTGAATLPTISLSRLVWRHLVAGNWPEIADRYVFDVRPLTDDRPYFAGYVKPGDLPRILERLEVLQDEWGYLLLWATLAVAAIGALLLIALPTVFGWRAFQDEARLFATIVYFACLGLGYIVVEVGLLSKSVLALGNHTIAAAIVIPGMLVLSGVGSLISGRCIDRARTILPVLLLAIAALLTGLALWIDVALDWIGCLQLSWRAICCFLLLSPAAIAMGFPMPIAMTVLARLGKERMFIWAWGINGCFSVVGAALVPLIGISFGLGMTLEIGALAYLIALPAAACMMLLRASLAGHRPTSVEAS